MAFRVYVCIGIGRAENQRLHTVLSIQIEAHKGDNQRGQHIHHSKEQVINPLRLLANLAMVGAVQCDGNSHTKHQIEGQVLKEGQQICPLKGAFPLPILRIVSRMAYTPPRTNTFLDTFLSNDRIYILIAFPADILFRKNNR